MSPDAGPKGPTKDKGAAVLLLLIVLAFSLEQAVEGVLWGTTAYVAFRALGGRKSRWLMGVLVAFVAFLVYEYALSYLSESVRHYSTGQDLRALHLLRDTTMPWNAGTGTAAFLVGKVMSLVKIAIGFKVAEWVFRKRLSGLNHQGTRP